MDGQLIYCCIRSYRVFELPSKYCNIGTLRAGAEPPIRGTLYAQDAVMLRRGNLWPNCYGPNT